MNVLRLNSGVAVITIALALPTVLPAQAAIERSEVQKTSDNTVLVVGYLQACAQAFGNPYTTRASTLESLLYKYLTATGYRTNTAKNKIGIFRQGLKQDHTHNKYDLGNIENLKNMANWTESELALSESFSLDSDESIMQRRTSKEFKTECGTWLTSADTDISDLTKLISESRASRARASSGNSCGHSADYYQERFRTSGKISDLTCFQRAGRRELQEAQDE